jgi:hypothetical protein
MIDYASAAHACYPHQAPLASPELPIRAITTVVAIVAVLTAVAAVAVSARSWRAARRAGAPSEDEERMGPAHLSRLRFVAVAGLMTSTLFTFGAILNGVSPALVAPCW